MGYLQAKHTTFSLKPLQRADEGSLLLLDLLEIALMSSSQIIYLLSSGKDVLNNVALDSLYRLNQFCYSVPLRKTCIPLRKTQTNKQTKILIFHLIHIDTQNIHSE
uniref:Uncharacterized protein n=1 Tax=Octopus bimaculoides TaxID=37653 RepID=A0A0L8IA92_OCTBM